MKRFFKRIYLKTVIAWRKQKYSQKSKYGSINTSKVSLFICLKLLKLDDSNLLIAPVSGDKYILNERLDILVSINYRKGTITEKSYSYDIHITEKDWDYLEKKFLSEMEKRTKLIEENIKSRIKHSLTNIYNKITKDDEKSSKTY